MTTPQACSPPTLQRQTYLLRTFFTAAEQCTNALKESDKVRTEKADRLSNEVAGRRAAILEQLNLANGYLSKAWQELQRLKCLKYFERWLEPPHVLPRPDRKVEENLKASVNEVYTASWQLDAASASLREWQRQQRRFLWSVLGLTFGAAALVTVAILCLTITFGYQTLQLVRNIQVTRTSVAQATIARHSEVWVPANAANGVSTGLQVHRGQIFSFSVIKGQWCWYDATNFFERDACSNADGTPESSSLDYPGVLSGQNLGMLIGKVGDWLFPIGTSCQVTITTDGYLYLLINDRAGEYLDNSGWSDVSIIDVTEH